MNIKPIKPIVLLVVLLLSLTVMAETVPEDRVKLELYSDGIRLVHQNKYFYAPYKVKSGENFTTLSEKFYNTHDFAVTLSEVNGMSPVEQLEPGSTVYITTLSVTLFYGKGLEEQQFQTIQQHINTVKDVSQLTYVWDGADIDMELTREGKWIINKYETSKLRIFDPIKQKPELHLSCEKKPVLDIMFGPKTYITGITIKK